MPSEKFSSEIPVHEDINDLLTLSPDDRPKKLTSYLDIHILESSKYNQYKTELFASIPKAQAMTRNLLNSYWSIRQTELNPLIDSLNKFKTSFPELSLSSEHKLQLVISKSSIFEFCVAMNECVSRLFENHLDNLKRLLKNKESEITRYEQALKDIPSSPVINELMEEYQAIDRRIQALTEYKNQALEVIQDWYQSHSQ